MMPLGIELGLSPGDFVLDGNFESVIYGTLCSELCKNGRTNRDAIWVVGSEGPKDSCIRVDPDPPWEAAILRGEGWSIVNYSFTAVS